MAELADPCTSLDVAEYLGISVGRTYRKLAGLAGERGPFGYKQYRAADVLAHLAPKPPKPKPTRSPRVSLATRVYEWWHIWGPDWIDCQTFLSSGENERMWWRMLSKMQECGVPHATRSDGKIKLVRLTPEAESWLAAQAT